MERELELNCMANGSRWSGFETSIKLDRRFYKRNILAPFIVGALLSIFLLSLTSSALRRRVPLALVGTFTHTYPHVYGPLGSDGADEQRIPPIQGRLWH